MELLCWFTRCSLWLFLVFIISIHLHSGECTDRDKIIKRRILKGENKSLVRRDRIRRSEWSCPQVSDSSSGISCQCDLPHTLRCAGLARSAEDITSIVRALRTLSAHQSVSLLDLSIQNLSRVNQMLFDKISLHGLVISSGEVSEVSYLAFFGLGPSLSALGLPNNRLTSIPFEALKHLIHLERLDLSNNRIHTIPSHQFNGLDNLRFLDLSGNVIQTLASEAFVSLPNLRSLHLRSNLLETSQFNTLTLRGLKKLQEIDLGYNKLRGRLTSSFLQGLDNLITLDLSFNNFTLLKRGMMSGLKRLSILRLTSNQVDVIEDQAFVSLTSLTSLDLSHNGVVAISGQSLSHLSSLKLLDLSHNYLRALNKDLVIGLSNLESLDLTDNDISLVQPGALADLRMLHHLSLTDNPLTCDCHLVDFALWLKNNTILKEEDHKSIVCATPPSLENGLLVETDVKMLTCDTGETASGTSLEENFLSFQPTEDFIRLSPAQVQFLSAELENSLLHTTWNVDAATLPYTCDAILVYELTKEHEILLDSYPVRCHSTEELNNKLQLTVKLGDNIKRDGQYRLCLVLFEGGHDDEASLLPGCSHPMDWETVKSTQPTDSDSKEDIDSEEEIKSKTQITAFYANVTAPNSVSVYMRIPDASPQCQFTVVVFENHQLIGRKTLNCSTISFTFTQLRHMKSDSTSEYEVCATFSRDGQFLPPPDGEREADGDIVLNSYKLPLIADKSTTNITQQPVQYSHCVVAKVPARIWAVENTLVVIAISVVFVLIAAALLVATYVIARRVFFRRKKLWCSSDPLSVPKATGRHILYVPETDYFPDCPSSSTDGREETSTNV